MSSQVIYKKFNISCPLDDGEDHNITHIPDHHFVSNATDDFCEAKLFTTNSQVRAKAFPHCVQFPGSSAVCLFLGQHSRFTATCSALERVMSIALRRVMPTAALGIIQAFNPVPGRT